MPKPEWGAKHICHNCGTRYYDMLRDPIVCPKCNTQFDPEAFLKSRRTRAASVEEVAPAKATAAKKKAAEPEEAAEEPEEVAEVELEADDDSPGIAALDADQSDGEDDESGDADITADVEDEEDEDDSDVLLEDASELGDDDVDDVVVPDTGDEDPNT